MDRSEIQANSFQEQQEMIDLLLQDLTKLESRTKREATQIESKVESSHNDLKEQFVHNIQDLQD